MSIVGRIVPIVLLLELAHPRAARPQAPSSPRQTSADEYTRYELLAPGSARFRILYDVSATAAGATHYCNSVRSGSTVSDIAVIDRMTGKPLPFDLVRGEGVLPCGIRSNDAEHEYIRVRLPRSIGRNGEIRLRIEKTYEDVASYSIDGDDLVFARSLGITRNAIVLPAGWRLTSANYPSQVRTEPDGRVMVSFINVGTAAVPYRVVAAAQETVPATPRSARIAERARQDREIVYFLRQPESHTFDLYHDYTESRPGADRYLNIVRAGSSVSNPAAKILDTGEDLPTETLRGDAIVRAGIDIGRPPTPETEVVVIRFAAVRAGESTRLRICETYTDSARYFIDGDELVWDRAFGRPANAVVLPEGWYLTGSSIPGVISETQDGRMRLDFINPRPDEIQVLITARRRVRR
ncbi:MAG TPA: hypothetical protein VMM18_13000 [Gemmatimonadaceae bacterium]|nr:hypothetical protein [Gemmatimonadaceae bacterium]